MIFATWKPPADIFYSGNQWLIKVELAGVAPDQVEIAADGDTLILRGSRRDLYLQKGYSCHTLEISYCNFERSIALPSRIDTSSIAWDYRDGMLQIQLTTEQ